MRGKRLFRLTGLFAAALAGLLSTLTATAQTSLNEEDVRYVLDRYVNSMGGKASLERIKSVRLSGSVTYPNGTRHSITVLKKKPNLVRVVLDTGIIRFIQAYDGKVAWFSREAGKNVFHDRMRGSLSENFIREAPLENVLIDPRDTGVVIELGEDVEVARMKCYQVIARFPDGSKVIHYIEKDSFLERRIFEYDQKGNLISELVPGKFEPINGITFAMQIVRMKGGETLSTLTLDEVQTNVGILDSAFAPPVELPPK